MAKIAVTGASGYIGRKTLLELLERKPAGDLVALVRDPLKASDLAGLGIELRKCDYLEPESLSVALDGIDKLMLVSAHAFTDRITAHSNVIDAAVRTGVRHLVFMPVMRKANSGFVMKEITNEDIFTESRIRSSGLTYTFAEHPVFLDFIATYIGNDASCAGVRVPAGSGKFSPASRDDLAAAHAVILSEPGHENRSYRLNGPLAISFSDIANILSVLADKQVPYVPVSDQEYVEAKVSEGWPEFVGEFALRWIQGINAGEWSDHSSDLERPLGRAPTTPIEFFRDVYLKS